MLWRIFYLKILQKEEKLVCFDDKNSKHEKKVCYGLTNLNILNYLPLHKLNKGFGTIEKNGVETVLFPSYIFIKIDKKSKNKVFEIDGIVKYISTAGKAAILKEEEIERIKRLSSYLGEIEIAKSNIEIGEEVEIIAGHFKGIRGKVVSIRGKYKLSIAIPAIGSCAKIEIDKEQIQKAM